MVVTAISYLIVQSVAFAYLADSSGETAKKVERPAAIVGLVVCFIFLIGYCIYQVLVPKLTEKRQKKLEEQRKQRNEKLKAILVLQNFPSFKRAFHIDDNEGALTLTYAKKWKERALELAKEKEEKGELDPLVSKEEKEEEEEEHSTENFKKDLGLAILNMILGTGFFSSLLSFFGNLNIFFFFD